MRIDALALGAQRSKHRFSGGLTPLALYRVRYTPHARGTRLDEALVERAWPALSNDLRAQSAALAATGVARAVAEPVGHDGAMFLLLGELYAAAENTRDANVLAGQLVRFTFDALAHTGHAIALDRCVRCDTPAPDMLRVTVDSAAGGIVCRGCGGGRYALAADERAALRAVIAGDFSRATTAMLRTAVALVEGMSVDAAGVVAAVAEIFG